MGNAIIDRTPLRKNALLGYIGEQRVRDILVLYGHHVTSKPINNKGFDLLMDRKIKIQVKTASPMRTKTEKMYWQFRIANYKKNIDESLVDMYILRFLDVPYTDSAVHAVLFPPLTQKWKIYSFKQLIEGAISDGVKIFKALNLHTRRK